MRACLVIQKLTFLAMPHGKQLVSKPSSRAPKPLLRILFQLTVSQGMSLCLMYLLTTFSFSNSKLWTWPNMTTMVCGMTMHIPHTIQKLFLLLMKDNWNCLALILPNWRLLHPMSRCFMSLPLLPQTTMLCWMRCAPVSWNM